MIKEAIRADCNPEERQTVSLFRARKLLTNSIKMRRFREAAAGYTNTT